MELEEGLKKLGWKKIFNGSWQNGNRYVDYDEKYVDVYIWKDGEKVAGYLTIEEYKLFYSLIKLHSPVDPSISSKTYW